MIGGVDAVSVNGVYVDIERLNVTLPLLLTYRNVYVVPKKSIGNGRVTAGVEPSSLRGSVFALQPGSGTIAFAAATGAGVTVSVAVALAPADVAVIVTLAAEVTAKVPIVKVPLPDPFGIVIGDETAATAGLLLVRVTDVVPLRPVSVTVPVDVLPPTTLVGLRLTDATGRGGAAAGET